MSPRDRFAAYRMVFATADDGVVCWWYSGNSYVVLPGQPDIPISQIAAIMTYRTETLSPDAFRVHWSEIGVFTNPVTGEEPESWTNSVTGILVQPPKTFQEGPGAYVVYRHEEGVRLELDQPSARIEELRVDFHESADRFAFVQVERKQRGFPRPDGKLPPLDPTPGTSAVTELAFYARTRDLAKPPAEPLRIQGAYRFTLSAIPRWMGFGELQGRTRTIGAITRARPGERLNSSAWRMMEQHFPREIVDPPAARVSR
jgi:hypothetical protein